MVFLSGCTPRTPATAPAVDPPKPAVAQTQTGQPDQPDPPKLGQPSQPKHDQLGNEQPLRQRIGELIRQKGVPVTPDGPRLFDLALSPAPQGYTRLVAAVADLKLFLVAVSDQGGAMLLQQIDDVLVNEAKLEIASTGDRITVWSQAPFRASSRIVELAWDGTRLTRVSQRLEDQTASYFQSRQRLIDAGDIDALMALGTGVKDLLYPDQELLYWSQPPQILKLAYAKALERYRAGDLPLALKTLQFGVKQYESPYGDILAETLPGHVLNTEHALPLRERIPIANDLAFFLAESKQYDQALPLLQNVVRLAPDRAVAHLNLADVLWELGKKAEARASYQKYLDLLDPDSKGKAPERVIQRING